MAKSKYDTQVKPRLDEIKEWVESGATDTEIIKQLDVSRPAFYKYIKQHEELGEIIQTGRTAKVKELTTALYEKAIGGKRTAKQEFELNKETGEMELVKEVIKYVPPNETAIMILLKHWDKNEDGTCKWSNEPAAIEMKRREVELKEKMAEENDWSFDSV